MAPFIDTDCRFVMFNACYDAAGESWLHEMRRTKEEAAITRLNILHAAEELFFREGFDGASLDRIAEAAGVKRGAVHFHFVNKIGLLVALAERETAAIMALADRLEADTTIAPLVALADLCAEIIESLEQNPRRRAVVRALIYADLKLDAEGVDDADLAGFDSRLYAAETKIVQSAETRGQLDATWTAETATAVLHAFMCGLMTSWSKRSRPNVKLVPDGVLAVRQLIAGFGARTSAPTWSERSS